MYQEEERAKAKPLRSNIQYAKGTAGKQLESGACGIEASHVTHSPNRSKGHCVGHEKMLHCILGTLTLIQEVPKPGSLGGNYLPHARHLSLI